MKRPSGGAPGHWLPPLLYIPLLYAIGWLLVQPLPLLGIDPGPETLALVGTGVSFLLFVLTLPVWIRRRWNRTRPWQALGLAVPTPVLVADLLRGVLIALALLAPIVLVLLLSGVARWSGTVAGWWVVNVLVMLVVVGLAEELVFRGWLWGELSTLLGENVSGGRRALLAQALIFALTHTRFTLGWSAMLALLFGLSLLGVVLALQRRADRGSLWGAVGLHGGLVGGWSLLEGGLIELSPAAPAWLAGPGGTSPNPIGSVMGWIGLGILLWFQRRG